MRVKPTTSSIGRLRRDALALFRENYALAILAQQTTKESYRASQGIEGRIGRASRERLEQQIDGSKRIISDLRGRLGCTADQEDLVRLFRDAGEAPSGLMLFIPKSMISQLCSNYDRVLPEYGRLPMHAQISMESGEFRERAGEVQIRVSEAIACEDLCALFNECAAAHLQMRHQSPIASHRKAMAALLRATVSAAHRLLEAYLNGKAHDRLAVDQGELKQKDMDLLREWNSKRERPGFLSLRDKVSAYQRILTGQSHPALNEGNCPVLARVLASAEDTRNPIVHPSPRSEMNEYEPGKYIFVGDLEFDQVKSLTTDVLELIRQLEIAISGGTEQIGLWHSRIGPDGRFGEEAFR